MLTLELGDNLLIRQTGDMVSLPWGYRLIHLPTNTVVASGSELESDYEILEMTTTSDFAAFLGQPILLEIIDEDSNILESDYFAISAFNDLPNIKRALGLMGENVIVSSALSTDYRDGHSLHKTITLYESSDLEEVLQTYDWTQSFEDDFIPDHRYQRSKIIQKETS